jgi:hydroxymethylpyrimidine pyrophosphatase-like HAD family hydrolase
MQAASGYIQMPPERVDVRLKRVYKVQLKNSEGCSETRYVLAKSVGWGWLSYHAFLAAQELQGLVPPMLSLRDGILYTEWVPEANNAAEVMAQNRDEEPELLARYVAARARNLRLSADPTPDLTRESRHKGFEMLSSALGRAYNSRVAAAFQRRHIQRKLSDQGCSVSVMTDSKMSPDEWIIAGSKLLKTDFEHHAQGKNELGMTDPAYDLAGAIFHFGLSEHESAQLLKTYVEESGDVNVADRLFLNKMLVGLWEQNLATLGLQTGKLLYRRNEFHQQYATAWNFLVMEAIQQCGKLCLRPAEIPWKTPLVVTDIDGVLDRMVFGFPCATAAGIKAISLLHSHNFGMAVNTARSLREVKQYCSSYGFAGGVAEYGAVLWDAVNQREAVLVGSCSLAQMVRVKKALQEIPGVFLNDDYQYSLRAVTYHNGRTAPLPPVLVQDLLGKLGVDRLRAHHTGLDTAIVDKETDKGAGLLQLLKLVGLSAEDTVAIGDSEPDLAMFRVAHSSFAPGHISCRREARLLRCWIASRAYQPGLLQIARQISHPDGGACDRCRSVESAWPKGKNLFLSLLSAADETPLRSLRKVLASSPLSLFFANNGN